MGWGEYDERLIPAHAGKTVPPRSYQARRPAHPRSRGENAKEPDWIPLRHGSSPLTRGKRRTSLPPSRLLAAHPRSRGENAPLTDVADDVRGSSPLTRGKHAMPAPYRALVRLIPAHAGKTLRALTHVQLREAHPRSRGENIRSPYLTADAAGSSPLTRGKPGARISGRSPVRLIPAHAGKTWSRRRRHRDIRAHPRSRGENFAALMRITALPGSSPLTRGKPTWRARVDLARRLIPAHAGKTSLSRLTPSRRWAHPRSRGENFGLVALSFADDGSSPLTRGKPDPWASQRSWIGLIPAHAGKTS